MKKNKSPHVSVNRGKLPTQINIQITNSSMNSLSSIHYPEKSLEPSSDLIFNTTPSAFYPPTSESQRNKSSSSVTVKAKHKSYRIERKKSTDKTRTITD